MSDEVVTETADGVTTVTINRPTALNALTVPVKIGLREALAAAEADPGCRAVVLAGAGERAFCVGQDLREHAENLKSGSGLTTVPEHYNPLAQTLFTMETPVVAALRGAAAGAGASLAFLSDFRIGGPATKLSTGIGLSADTGASYSLSRLVGRAKAAELLMLNTSVDATEALRLGLLTELVDSDDAVLPRAQELAARLAAGPTVAYGWIKKQLRVDGDFAPEDDVDRVLTRDPGFDDFTDLARDPMLTADRLDWTAKLKLLEAYRERDGLSWASGRLGMVDLQYSDVRLAKGLYNRLVTRGSMRRVVTEEEVTAAMTEPPEDTRAYFRGTCMSRYPADVTAASWSSVVFDVGRESLVRIPTLEPLRGTRKHVGELFDTVSSAEELVDKLTAN